MEIFFWILGSSLFYAAGLGYTIRYVDNNVKWTKDTVWVSSVFGWPFVLTAVALWDFQRGVEHWWKGRKEFVATKKALKALPPINIKRGAKIEEFRQYKQLKKMCSDFEIENDFDRILEHE
jgi:hypothetical protein